jgi:hypothetical protein
VPIDCRSQLHALNTSPVRRVFPLHLDGDVVESQTASSLVGHRGCGPAAGVSCLQAGLFPSSSLFLLHLQSRRINSIPRLLRTPDRKIPYVVLAAAKYLGSQCHPVIWDRNGTCRDQKLQLVGVNLSRRPSHRPHILESSPSMMLSQVGSSSTLSGPILPPTPSLICTADAGGFASRNRSGLEPQGWHLLQNQANHSPAGPRQPAVYEALHEKHGDATRGSFVPPTARPRPVGRP